MSSLNLQLPSIPFLDIKISIKGNGLCTSVYFKPTDSHSYLLYSSSHPYHVKNSIPFSRFLRLRCLGSDDSVFPKNQRQCAKFSINVAILFLNSIPFLRFLRLHCLCSDDSVFSEKFCHNVPNFR